MIENEHILKDLMKDESHLDSTLDERCKKSCERHYRPELNSFFWITDINDENQDTDDIESLV